MIQVKVEYWKRNWLKGSWKQYTRMGIGQGKTKTYVFEWQDWNGIYRIRGQVLIRTSLLLDQCALWTTLHCIPPWRAQIEEEWTRFRTSAQVSSSISLPMSWDQIIRSESTDIDWKEKIALYNFALYNPLWHGLILRIMSTSHGGGLSGKLGSCLRMKSQICKYIYN